MRLDPVIVPHGIDWESWQHSEENAGFVLWNKNRTGDVCDTGALDRLIDARPDVHFVTTFAGESQAGRPNVAVTGVIPHVQMKVVVQRCGVYLSTTKETFGIGILEAMAAGKPVLGFRRGGIVDLVEHGVNGYLADPDDLADLEAGLAYCVKYAADLGANGREMARDWTWEVVAEIVAGAYRQALEPDPPTAAIVIPSFKYAEHVSRAARSALAQTHPLITDVIVVDDASPDDGATEKVVKQLPVTLAEESEQIRAKVGELQAEVDAFYARRDDALKEADDVLVQIGIAEKADDVPLASELVKRLDDLKDAANSADKAGREVAVRLGNAKELLTSAEHLADRARLVLRYIRHPENYGVAVARNTGIRATRAKYVACLDADDAVHPEFIAKLAYALEGDRSLGIAYSKLRIMQGDGGMFESRWPDECDFDRQVAGHNQVPTCCLFRREMWARLGGYRARYAPEGCGTEDAEFWLRAGAYGWGMKLATREPLFLYTLGGHTTGGTGYREVDYTVWHPWVEDGQHPFASIATPRHNAHSHDVRQYDEPVVSIVIPVGPGHGHAVVNALDSLEAQTYRKWEAIVAWDVGEVPDDVLRAYPHARHVFLVDHGQLSKGAGVARNAGARLARAPLLLFLDSDDWLFPRALEEMVAEYAAQDHPVAVYSDHVGLSVIEDRGVLDKIEKEGRLLQVEAGGRAVTRHYNLDYDQARVGRQPDLENPYLWCNIATLHPTEWFHDVGGFDEEMWSWEDWDYWLRLARRGACFVRVPEPLLVYQFYSGDRRELGRQNAAPLVQYMRAKFEGEEMTPCTNCGGSRRQTHSVLDRGGRNLPGVTAAAPDGALVAQAVDADMIECVYTHPNKGDHACSGVHVFQQQIPGLPMQRSGAGWTMSYGYRCQGDKFLVHKKDVEGAPHWFKPTNKSEGVVNVARARSAPRQAPAPPPVPAARPEPTVAVSRPEPVVQTPAEPPPPTGAPTFKQMVDDALAAAPLGAVDDAAEIAQGAPVTDAVAVLFDFQTIPGVTSEIAEQMVGAGMRTARDVIDAGGAKLQAFRGIGPAKAEIILAAAAEKLAPPPPPADVEKEIERIMAVGA